VFSDEFTDMPEKRFKTLVSGRMSLARLKTIAKDSRQENPYLKSKTNFGI